VIRRWALAVAIVAACGAPTRPASSPREPSARRTTPPRRPAATARTPRPTPPPPPAAVTPDAVAPDAPATVAAIEHGKAAWYGSGKRTASGERFDKRAMTAAHRTLPFGTWVRVTAVRTGRSVVVRINDRGPFGDRRRIIDLSEGAARKLGIIDAGVAAVTVEILPGAP
jgi:rare lipoprotein A